MSQQTRVAVVTGSNKGVGFAIVKGLAKNLQDGIVYLTSRNEQLGKEAVARLAADGVFVKYHQLDIDNTESITAFSNYLKNTHAGLDILVNNAAIAYKRADTAPFSEQATNTVRINYTGTVNLCNALFPLLRSHGRVVNVASRSGMLKYCKDKQLRDRLTSPTATLSDVSAVLNEFVEASQTGKHEHISDSWYSAYSMSKVGLIAATLVQQRILSEDSSRSDLIVNACCPGYVDTDMTSHMGKLTPDQGAETPIYLALIPENATEPKGDFIAEKKKIDWVDLSYELVL